MAYSSRSSMPRCSPWTRRSLYVVLIAGVALLPPSQGIQNIASDSDAGQQPQPYKRERLEEISKPQIPKKRSFNLEKIKTRERLKKSREAKTLQQPKDLEETKKVQNDKPFERHPPIGGETLGTHTEADTKADTTAQPTADAAADTVKQKVEAIQKRLKELQTAHEKQAATSGEKQAAASDQKQETKKDADKATLLPDKTNLTKEAAAVLGRCHNLKKPHFPDLTCRLIADNTYKGTIFVSFVNDVYADMGVSWAANIEAATGQKKMLLGAMTDNVFKKLQSQGIPSFRMNSQAGAAELNWGSKDFKEMGRDKARLAAQLLKMRSPNIVLTDSDVMWVGDPLPYFERYPKADILVSADGAGSDRLAEEEPFKYKPKSQDIATKTALMAEDNLPFVNIGIIFFRATKESKGFAKQWQQMVESGDTWDQQVFNDMLTLTRRAMHVDHELLNTRRSGYNVSWGILPNAQFANGEDFFVGHLDEKLGVPLYAVHVDYTGGFNGKRAKLRSAGLWADDDEYFQGKFLALDTIIPKDLLKPYENIDVNFEAPQRHMQLVNHQLRQVAYAAAIARGLGRTLVLPEIFCTCEYYWAPTHDKRCRFPTQQGQPVATEMPYVCPPDQIFNFNVMDRELPHRHAGFLNSHRLPYNTSDFALVDSSSVGNSNENVMFSQVFQTKRPELSEHQHVKLQVEKPLTMNAVVEQLEAYKDKPVLVLKAGQAAALLQGFDTNEDREQFQSSMAASTGMWCCSDANMVQGPVKYHNLGDSVPGWPAYLASETPPPACVPDYVHKDTNAKTAPWNQSKFGARLGAWWGENYPEIAKQQCEKKGDPDRCADSTEGLCKCPPGSEGITKERANVRTSKTCSDHGLAPTSGKSVIQSRESEEMINLMADFERYSTSMASRASIMELQKTSRTVTAVPYNAESVQLSTPDRKNSGSSVAADPTSGMMRRESPPLPK